MELGTLVDFVVSCLTQPSQLSTTNQRPSRSNRPRKPLTPEDLLAAVAIWHICDLDLVDVALLVAFGDVKGQFELVAVETCGVEEGVVVFVESAGAADVVAWE